MPTIATASPPTSEVRFISSSGAAMVRPREWMPCLIEVLCDVDSWRDVAVAVNGRPLPVSARDIGGRPAVVAEWDRSGPGWFELEVSVSGIQQHRQRIRVDPEKLSREAFASILEDLEVRLPVSLAVALRDSGARLGVTLEEAQPHTLEEEVARLRRALLGKDGRPGLAEVLRRVAQDPHKRLATVGLWVERRHARRPDPTRLVEAMWRAGNMEDGKPRRVLDQRVELSMDLYENQMLKAFCYLVESRLRRLRVLFSQDERWSSLAGDLEGLLDVFVSARSLATFLDEVSDLRSAPNRVTMVLARRVDYRAAYEGYLDFRRRSVVHLDEPALAEPLRGVPYLYQVWGTLLVLDATVNAAVEAGFTTTGQRLIWPQAGGLFVRVLRDNHAALTMRRPDGAALRVFHERSYPKGGKPLGSVSFGQRPDIAVELIRPDGQWEAVLFDPKYKLDSEKDAEPGDGTPKKVDIDKMHAYRDAIRGPNGVQAVRYAATLYPGKTVTFGDQLAAIRLYPGEEAGMHRVVESVIGRWLADS